MSEEMIELAERCEAATVPDRELDAAIARLLSNSVESDDGDFWWGPHDEPPIRVPDFTSSLDAAMTLVPEGWHIAHSGEGRFLTRGRYAVTLETWGCEQADDGSDIHTTPSRKHGVAETFPLALCATALRSRSEKGGTING